MGNILCFISDEFADFEVVFALHLLKNIAKKNIQLISCEKNQVIAQSSIKYSPDLKIRDINNIENIEGLIFPGGPLKESSCEIYDLIKLLNSKNKLLAAICYGPQYLARSKILHNVSYTTSCSEEYIKTLGMEDPFPRQNFVDKKVVTSNNIITAKGDGFIDFAFSVVSYYNLDDSKEKELVKLYKKMTGKKLTLF